MSNTNPATKREALLAELIGDMHGLLSRADSIIKEVEKLDTSIKNSTSALAAATVQHREAIDVTVSTIKKETSNLLISATDQAAKAVVGQQTNVLEQAAIKTMQGPVFAQLKRDNRFNIIVAVIAASVLSAIFTTALLKLLKL
jgi:septal ring-binding cell division protein DamX